MAKGTANAGAPAARTKRPTLDELDLPLGKRVRLHRLLYEHGPGNGTLLVLPIDQGLEHGPVDFLTNPPSADPEYQWRLALEGGYSAIACHWGLARQYMKKYAGEIPLAEVDAIAKKVPDALGHDAGQRLEAEPALREMVAADERVARCSTTPAAWRACRATPASTPPG